MAYLEDPANAARLHVDPRHIAIAGHSMGGIMAADAAADDRSVIGLFLIEAWDISADARALSTPDGARATHEDMIGNLPPLQGTDEAALTNEMRTSGARFDLGTRVIAYGRRPLDIIGAERAYGAANAVILRAARTSGNNLATGATWPTDHSFNDRRIALSRRLVSWLGRFPKSR